MLAHIAGVPVEETALSLGPIVAATGGIAGLKLRARRATRQARGSGDRAGIPRRLGGKRQLRRDGSPP